MWLSARNHRCKHRKLPVVAGVSPANPAPSHSCEYNKRVREWVRTVRGHLVNAEGCSHGAVSLCFREQHRRSASTERGGYSGFAIIAVVRLQLLARRRKSPRPQPTPQTAGQPVATTVEVIVTGSNIPTAEEVGPQPVDTYRKVDIERLGVRSATDFVQKLPVASGPSINENRKHHR